MLCAVAATSGCSRDRDRHLPHPSPSSAPAPRSNPTSAVPVADAGLGPRIAVLDAPSGSDEAKVVVIESLAGDRSEAVTGVLLRFVDDPSTLIAAASIKGLTSRGCNRVETALVRLLNDEDWQRRAWAAKVLGTNGCHGAESALGDRLRREGDDRVKARLEEARQRLGEAGR
jgi:HEAT repeat protein